MRIAQLFHQWRHQVAKLSLLIAIAGSAAFAFQAGFAGYHQGLHSAESLAQYSSESEKAHFHQSASCEVCSILQNSVPDVPSVLAVSIERSFGFLEFVFSPQVPAVQYFGCADARAPPRV